LCPLIFGLQTWMVFFTMPHVSLVLYVGSKGEDPRGKYCIQKKCYEVFKDHVDFGTAQKHCEDRKGRLMTVRSLISHSILLILLGIHTGDYWIGLQLPSGQCPDQELVLRGFRWITGNNETKFQNWRHYDGNCSSRCISVSKYDFTWETQRCNSKIDGFICEIDLENPCQRLDPALGRFECRCQKGYDMENGTCVKWDACFMSPCEHICTSTNGGYTCSCFDGHIPMSNNPNRCEIACLKAECNPKCDNNLNQHCTCPNGFILDERNNSKMCVDIDECDSKSYCTHNCTNTYGGFICSCDEGFDLVDRFNCVEGNLSYGSGLATQYTPGLRPPTEIPSTVTAGVFFGTIISIVIVILVMIILIHLVLKRRGRLDITFENQSVIFNDLPQFTADKYKNKSFDRYVIYDNQYVIG
uniref:Thrombomodulin n=1 Tax=Esox lucius TaxID=8010 RepID=A0A6Q2XQU9_ESOLU